MSKSQILKIIFNTAFGVILILLWANFVDFGQIRVALEKTNPIYLLPIFIVMVLAPFLRALRLKILLDSVAKISLKDLFFLNGFAALLNFFIPIRGGEIAKGIYLNQVYQLPIAKSLLWIFIDRFIDFMAVIILSAILLFFVPTQLPDSIIFVFLGLSIFLLSSTYLATYKADLSKKIFFLLKPLLLFRVLKENSERLINFLLEVFQILKLHPRNIFYITILTILAYGMDAAIVYFAFLALQNGQPYIDMYFGQTMSSLTYLIPAAPGYVGSAEASAIVVYNVILGISRNLSSAMILIVHVATALFIIVYGLISIYSLKIDTQSIIKKIFRQKS